MASQSTSADPRDYGNAKLVYIMNFVGFVFPLSALAALAVAYLSDKSDKVVKSHLQFQIRTFWWTFLMFFLGIIGAFFVVGYFILLFAFIYALVRYISGFMLLSNGVEVTGSKSLNLVAT
ncbi:hypothetical protein [Celeribacter sp.]|uniref:hypothetical protein n=1 Tax=Celeribacter sp. TaxID=1890673 RepID=UPI003A901CDF